LDYKAVSIVSIWFFCTSIIAMSNRLTGMPFTETLIIIGIAVAMTITVLVTGSWKEQQKINSLNTELSGLKTTMNTMNTRIEQLTEYLEE
jgi:cell division protein FtsL